VLNIKTTVHPSFCLWQDEEQLTVNKELDGPLIQLNSWMVATANILMIQDNARSHYAFVLISTLEWHLVQPLISPKKIISPIKKHYSSILEQKS